MNNDIFLKLSRSKFRSKFHLEPKDIKYIEDKGLDVIKKHAEDFIKIRLAPGYNPKDGKQTPWKGHPVFVGEHATATCCRSCLEKWHHIQKGHDLTKEEQEYVVDIIMTWIKKELALANHH